MSRRKDQERFVRLKEQNPDYVGFRGAGIITAKATMCCSWTGTDAATGSNS